MLVLFRFESHTKFNLRNNRYFTRRRGYQGRQGRYEPGSRYVYSGGAFTLLQLVIEEVTGLSFEEYMKTSILLPLGMNESGFESIPAEKEVVSVVFNHQNEIANGRFFAAKAAAGLYTSSSDLASLALAMMLTEVNSQTVNILTDTTLREMYQPQPGLSMRTPYGLGYMLQILPSSGLTEVSHTGSNKPGWNSLITTLPQKGEGLVILTNSPGGLQLRQELGKDWLFWTTERCLLPIESTKWSMVWFSCCRVG